MASLLDDPALVAPELAAIVRAMATSPAPMAVSAARAVVTSLQAGSLVGLQTSSRRAWIKRRFPAAEPVRVDGGAVCQSAYLRASPRDERDVVGWITTQDGFRGGAMVLAHEITHFRARFLAWQLAQDAAPLVDPGLAAGVDRARIGGIRAQLVNEIAARHAAFLLETGRSPHTGLPKPGALFACAVKIASYPEVYNDVGVMAALVARRDDGLLRDQVGLWISGLERFPFFDEGSALAREHAAWLTAEVALARKGRRAPVVPAEGTL